MFLAMIEATNGTWLDADRADRYLVEMAGGKMLVADAVIAIRLRGEMVGAEDGMTEITLAHALFTAFFATFCTVDRVGGELPTAWTFGQTVEAKGFAAAIDLIEARADLARTFTADHQTIITKTLAGRGTDAKLRAVLLATWATNGTISTYERICAIFAFNRIGA